MKQFISLQSADVVQLPPFGTRVGVAVPAAAALQMPLTQFSEAQSAGVVQLPPFGTGVLVGVADGVAAALHPPMVSKPANVTSPAAVAKARPARLTGRIMVPAPT